MTSLEAPEPSPGLEEGLEEASPEAPPPRKSSRASLRREGARFRRLRRVVLNPWFEPLATILAVVVILVGLYAYTGNWPPLVVVESASMQHGLGDTVGVINTGDLVLVQTVNVPGGVTTYVVGESTDYKTYGEFGDVLLYYRYGQTDTTPVIHRAIIWLDWNASAGEYSAPSLEDISCNTPAAGGQYQVGTSDNEATAGCPGSGYLNNGLPGPDPTIFLYNVGWQSVTVDIQLGPLMQDQTSTIGTLIVPHSGFITMGDDNCIPQNDPPQCLYGTEGEYDEAPGADIVTGLVQPNWVEGVARGMIPWFGAIKLWLSGEAYDVPSQTWEYLGLTIFAIIAIPIFVPRILKVIRGARRSRNSGEGDGEGEVGGTAEQRSGPPDESSEGTSRDHPA